jgi:hypothetical protein
MSPDAQNEAAELEKTTHWLHELLKERLAALLELQEVDFSSIELELRVGEISRARST